MICAIVFSSMAGYAFAKLNFKGKNFLFTLVLVQMMMPSQIFVIPQYQMLAKMGLTNSMFALVFPGLVSAFGYLLPAAGLHGASPDELGEAAYLDGCTQWQTFTKVMLPLTKASMAALTIFTAVFAYADLMWPLIVTSNTSMRTLTNGLAMFVDSSLQYGTAFAGAFISICPMLVLYIFGQRYFVEGTATSGLKG